MGKMNKKSIRLCSVLCLIGDNEKFCVCGDMNSIFFSGDSDEYKKSVWYGILPDYKVVKISAENGCIYIYIDA